MCFLVRDISLKLEINLERVLVSVSVSESVLYHVSIG